MDVMDMRRGLMMALRSGSGLRFATGTVEIGTQTNTAPVVTHNLGTKKIFALWWAESGTEYASFNRIGYQSFINWWDIIPDSYYITVNKGTGAEANVTFDKTEKKTQVEHFASKDKIVSQGYNRSYSEYNLTDNSVKLTGPYVNVWSPGTYHWLVIALDEALQ